MALPDDLRSLLPEHMHTFGDNFYNALLKIKFATEIQTDTELTASECEALVLGFSGMVTQIKLQGQIIEAFRIASQMKGQDEE